MDIIIYNKTQIATWQLEIGRLTKQIAELDHLTALSAAEKEQKKHSLQERIELLNTHIVQGNQFLNDLEMAPQILVTALRDKISSLKEYEKDKKHPVHMRVCLYRLDDKLKFITQSTEVNLPRTAIHIQYLKLCALVQEMFHEVDNKGTDPILLGFKKLLEELLESTHINMGGDLPDNMRIGQTTIAYRTDFIKDRDLFPTTKQLLAYEREARRAKGNLAKDQTVTDNDGDELALATEPEEQLTSKVLSSATTTGPSAESAPVAKSEEELTPTVQKSATATGTSDEPTPTLKPEEPLATKIEIGKAAPAKDKSTPTPASIEAQFDEMLKKLRARIVVKDDTLQAKINEAVEAVSEEVRVKKQRKEKIDYHLYNQLLTYLWDLSDPKTTTDTTTFITRLTKLTEEVIDTSSLGKKIAGAILGIVGILLVAASIATLVTTFGGSSLVSSVGIAFGVSLLSAKMVLSTAAVVTTAAGAGLTFWGVNTFKEGQGRELSRTISEVKEELTQRETFIKTNLSDKPSFNPPPAVTGLISEYVGSMFSPAPEVVSPEVPLEEVASLTV